MFKAETIHAFSEGKFAKIVLWLLLCIYAVAVLYGMSFHEPWRDEAQAWLVVRDLGFADVLHLLPSEGHPPLWYICIFPLAKLGLPYSSIHLLTAVIMIAAVYLFLFRTNAFYPVKVILPFSYFFFYEYSLLARSYCLVTFFIIAIIALYPYRYQRGWLFAFCVTGLYGSHVLAFGTASMLVFLYMLDGLQAKKIKGVNLYAFLMMAFTGVYVLYTLVNSENKTAFESIIQDHSGRIAMAISEGLFAFQAVILALIIFGVIVLLMVPRPKILVLLIGSTASIVYILGYKYPGDLRHYGVVFMEILLAICLMGYYTDEVPAVLKKYSAITIYTANWVLLVLLCCQLKPSFGAYIRDKNEVYSDGIHVAAFLKDKGLENSLIVSHRAWSGSAVLPYLPAHTKFYYPEALEYGTYYKFYPWFAKQRWKYGADFAVETAYILFNRRLGEVVFVLNTPLSANSMNYMEQLYATPDTPIQQDEMYYIYRFKKKIKK